VKAEDIDHIYRDGRHYDRLFGPPHLPFWLELAHQLGGPILELGCGTGNISIPLTEAGFEVVGLDLSEAMLREARNKTQGRDIPVQWVYGDMTQFSLDRRFSLIILPSNNLCHLLSIEEVEGCFQCVRNHLANAGRFVIDVFVPYLKLLIQEPSSKEVLSEYDDPDSGGRVVVTVTSVYEPHTQIKRNITCQKSPGRPDVIGHLDMRMFFPQELDALLKYNGFRIHQKYGDYDRNEFGKNSGKQLIVAAAAQERNG
jgi:SAM-dependent methyltransferase